MGLNDEGFLSPDIKDWIIKHRNDNRRLFALADELSKLGMRTLYTSNPTRDSNQQLLVSILFARTLSHFQSAILLSERGMVPDTKILVRVMSDAVYSLGACAKDPNFVDELVKDDRNRQADLIRALLGVPHEHIPLTAKQIDDLKQQRIKLRAEVKSENTQRLKPYAIADRAGLLDHYRLIYSPFSNTVHAAIRDLETHVNADPDGNIVSLRWGPNSAGIEEVLMAAMITFFHALDFVAQVFPKLEVSEDIGRLWIEAKPHLT